MSEIDFFIQIFETLKAQPVLTLFLILGTGYLIGNIRITGFSLGPVAGVLFAGLLLGHFGFLMSPNTQALGFALFIFSVGYQAGPHFFDVLKTDGLKYFSLALVVACTGFGTVVAITRLLSLEPGVGAGLLAGGLTSSPTLAAAQEAIRTGQVPPPDGWPAEAVIGNIATVFAITYIFGLASLISIINFLPRALGIDLVSEAEQLEGKKSGGNVAACANVQVRFYRVTNEEITTAPLAEFRKRFCDGISVVRVRRHGSLRTIESLGFLQLGDELEILGPVEYFTGAINDICEEFLPEGLCPGPRTETVPIVVINADAVGRTLGELDIARKFGVVVARVQRMRIEIPNTGRLELQKGDILTVVGPKENVDLLGEMVGQVEREITETDMVTFALGIAGGVGLGMLSIRVGGISIGLGSAGGLLAAGIMIGFLRTVRPTFGRLPDGARWFLMEFGLLLFMAGVGLRAGGDIVQTFSRVGPTLILAGILVTMMTMGVAYFFGRKVLKLNPALLFGAITGAMTSGAALSIVTREAKSSVPALGYTGAYAFSSVLLAIAGGLILLF